MFLQLQICGSVVMSLVYINFGALMGFPTKALPQLRNETNIKVNLDDYEGSMFASIAFITGFHFFLVLQFDKNFGGVL